ncbi:dienelactone hydrolase family protein [Flavisphingomonas formosensis]|uniref:dienelactone hydrolase family protein n=1 Tax=Flavisphingomonas formosensis TaxID=861534 RepID=UPI0012F8B708|nr:dienelactone hydrolase family protein [Sphingomonas formosensis]
MSRETVSIRTTDGECPTYVLTPGGTGPWPAVIFYMDALAIRPALVDMAQKLADGGYLVLLPDLFYRAGAYEPIDPKVAFAGDLRVVIGPLMATTNAQKAAEDTGALLTYLDTRSDVKGRKVGVTGYCMGGGIALTVAGTYPDRIAAAASFHGGNLATDADLSPHRMAPSIKGRVYVAGADKDAHYPPEMEARLDEALTQAGVDHRCEIYEGALHGWTMSDFPVYNTDAADRHWHELFALFGETLD